MWNDEWERFVVTKLCTKECMDCPLNKTKTNSNCLSLTRDNPELAKIIISRYIQSIDYSK